MFVVKEEGDEAFTVGIGRFWYESSDDVAVDIDGHTRQAPVAKPDFIVVPTSFPRLVELRCDWCVLFG